MGVSETNLDAEEVVNKAAYLSTLSGDLHERVSGPLAEIRAINTAAPWGTDDAGNAFRDAYLGEPGSDSGVDNILDGCEDLCEYVGVLAENTGTSALASQGTDEDAGAQLQATIDELQGTMAEVRGAIEGYSAD